MFKTIFGKSSGHKNDRSNVQQLLSDPLFVDTMIKGNACLARLVHSVLDAAMEHADLGTLTSYAKQAFDANALAYFTGNHKGYSVGIYILRAIQKYVADSFSMSDASLCQCITDKLPHSNENPNVASKMCTEKPDSRFLQQVKAVARAHVETELENRLTDALTPLIKTAFQPYVGIYYAYTKVVNDKRLPQFKSEYSIKQHQYWSEVLRRVENKAQLEKEAQEQAAIDAAWSHGHRYWNAATGQPVKASDFPASPELDRNKNRYSTSFHKFKVAAKRPTSFSEQDLSSETQAFVDKAWAAGVQYWDHDGLPFVPPATTLFPLFDVEGMDRHSPSFHHFRDAVYRPTKYDPKFFSAQSQDRTNDHPRRNSEPKGTTSAPAVLTRKRGSYQNTSVAVNVPRHHAKLARTSSDPAHPTATTRMPNHVRARYMTRSEKNAERRDPASTAVNNSNIARRIIKSLVSQHVYDMGNVISRIRKYARVSKLVEGLSACSTIKQYRLGKPLSTDGSPRFVFGKSMNTKNTDISLAEVKAQPIVSTRKFLGKGAYGQAWVASSAKGNLSNLVRFAVKLASEDDREAEKMRVLTKHVLGIPNANGTKDYFINFPMLYGSKECTSVQGPASQMRYAIFSELASGDLVGLLTRPDPDTRAAMSFREFSSCIMQVIMGILKLRELGFVHDDLHPGNILYHKITPGGYWWYQVNGKDFFIENVGKLIVLWDFGMTKAITWDVPSGAIPTTDIYRLCSSTQHVVRTSPGARALDPRVLDFLEIMYKKVEGAASGPNVLGKYWEHLIHPFLVEHTENARFLPILNSTDLVTTLYQAAYRSPVKYADISGSIINKTPFKVSINAIANRGALQLGMQPYYATSQRFAEYLDQKMAGVLQRYNVHRPRVRP